MEFIPGKLYKIDATGVSFNVLNFYRFVPVGNDNEGKIINFYVGHDVIVMFIKKSHGTNEYYFLLEDTVWRFRKGKTGLEASDINRFFKRVL